jgi:hypothetical protein
MTRSGHFGCQFAVWFGVVSDGLVRRHAIVIANLMFSICADGANGHTAIANARGHIDKAIPLTEQHRVSSYADVKSKQAFRYKDLCGVRSAFSLFII